MHHPTMRSLVGAPATTRLDAPTSALIVIDFQMEYFAGAVPGKLLIPDGPAALGNAQKLIAFADAHRIAVFHVQHVGAAGGVLFARDGAHLAIHPDILPAPHHVLVQKSQASSFVGTELHAQLQARNIKTLIVCGLMTHNCISSTVRDARPLGYQSIVAGDACATRSIVGWDGGVVTHAELHHAELTGLSDGFCEVLRTERVTALTVQ